MKETRASCLRRLTTTGNLKIFIQVANFSHGTMCVFGILAIVQSPLTKKNERRKSVSLKSGNDTTFDILKSVFNFQYADVELKSYLPF